MIDYFYTNKKFPKMCISPCKCVASVGKLLSDHAAGILPPLTSIFNLFMAPYPQKTMKNHTFCWLFRQKAVPLQAKSRK